MYFCQSAVIQGSILISLNGVLIQIFWQFKNDKIVSCFFKAWGN